MNVMIKWKQFQRPDNIIWIGSDDDMVDYIFPTQKSLAREKINGKTKWKNRGNKTEKKEIEIENNRV